MTRTPGWVSVFLQTQSFLSKRAFSIYSNFSKKKRFLNHCLKIETLEIQVFRVVCNLVKFKKEMT